MTSSSHTETFTNTYDVIESPARASRQHVGQVACVARSTAGVHLILTAAAARVLSRQIGVDALSAATRPRTGLDSQLWAGVALDLEAAAELGDLDAATNPDDVLTTPALVPAWPRHRDNGQVATALAWTRTPNSYHPRHAKTPNEIEAAR